MTEKATQLLKSLNYTDRSQLKAELIGLLTEDKIYAQALLALLFGEVYGENTDSVYDNYFLAIINGTVINPGTEAKKENILIYKDRIIATGSNLPDTFPEDVDNISVIDAKGLIITPGLIDQHIHGGYGCDFNQSSSKDMLNLANQLPRHGITAIVPTIMTAPKDVIKNQINKVKLAKEQLPENYTKFLGIHLEGPYLSQKYKGIQPEMDILPPAIEGFKKIEDPEIRIVSYAPELDQDFELTRYLAEKNIVPSAGHTSASAEEINEAVKNGLKQITHMFNAMAPLHHRNPGVIGAALTNDDLYVEVIPDGLHLNPVIIDLILRAKPQDKVIFISDSLPLNQHSEDSLIFGGQEIFRKDNRAVNADGTLAGSLIFLDRAVKNLQQWNLGGLTSSLRFTSLNIAENLGYSELGYIDRDKIADIVLWNTDNKVNTTIINGKIAFKL